MNKRNFLKLFGLLPAIPVAAKVVDMLPHAQAVTTPILVRGPEMTATEVKRRVDEYVKNAAHRIADPPLLVTREFAFSYTDEGHSLSPEETKKLYSL